MISGSIGVFGSGMVTMPTGEHITEVRVTRSGANTFDAGRVYLQWN
jgi:hypothetical protein